MERKAVKALKQTTAKCEGWNLNYVNDSNIKMGGGGEDHGSNQKLGQAISKRKKTQRGLNTR